MIILECFRIVFLQELNSSNIDQYLRGTKLVKILGLVLSLNAKKRLLIELSGQIEILMLSQEVRHLVHDAKGVIFLGVAALQPLFQDLDDGLTLVELLNRQVQVHELQIHAVKLCRYLLLADVLHFKLDPMV